MELNGAAALQGGGASGADQEASASAASDAEVAAHWGCWCLTRGTGRHSASVAHLRLLDVFVVVKEGQVALHEDMHTWGLYGCSRGLCGRVPRQQTRTACKLSRASAAVFQSCCTSAYQLTCFACQISPCTRRAPAARGTAALPAPPRPSCQSGTSWLAPARRMQGCRNS